MSMDVLMVERLDRPSSVLTLFLAKTSTLLTYVLIFLIKYSFCGLPRNS